MGKEKRMIGDYTVLCSVNVGEKEVILASNEQSTDGEKFLCGFVERNDLFELCKECVVSDDYIEIAHTFGAVLSMKRSCSRSRSKSWRFPSRSLPKQTVFPTIIQKTSTARLLPLIRRY